MPEIPERAEMLRQIAPRLAKEVSAALIMRRVDRVEQILRVFREVRTLRVTSGRMETKEDRLIF